MPLQPQPLLQPLSQPQSLRWKRALRRSKKDGPLSQPHDDAAAQPHDGAAPQPQSDEDQPQWPFILEKRPSLSQPHDEAAAQPQPQSSCRAKRARSLAKKPSLSQPQPESQLLQPPQPQPPPLYGAPAETGPA